MAFRPDSASKCSKKRRTLLRAAFAAIERAYVRTASSAASSTTLPIAGCRLPGDDDARHQALEIPLPGSPRRLVEVVEVEHERALRRGEEAEVRDVRVTAGGDEDPAVRVAGEVCGLDRGGAAVEREGAGRHALDAQRDELGEPPLVLGVEDSERIPVTGGEVGEPAPRHRTARVLAGRHALLHRRRSRPLQRRCIRVRHGHIMAPARRRCHGPGRSPRRAVTPLG